MSQVGYHRGTSVILCRLLNWVKLTRIGGSSGKTSLSWMCLLGISHFFSDRPTHRYQICSCKLFINILCSSFGYIGLYSIYFVVFTRRALVVRSAKSGLQLKTTHLSWHFIWYIMHLIKCILFDVFLSSLNFCSKTISQYFCGFWWWFSVFYLKIALFYHIFLALILVFGYLPISRLYTR